MITNHLENWYNLFPNNCFYQTIKLIDADFLDFLLGITPADNIQNLEFNINWLSILNGKHFKSLFSISQQQKALLSAVGLPTYWTEFWFEKMVKDAEKAVEKGEEPDSVEADNMRIDSAYAEKIKLIVKELTTEILITENDKEEKKLVFDRDKCRRLCESPSGQFWLISKIMEFSALEWQYHSIGETRIKAYKRLLRTLLQVITWQVLSNEKKQPYRRFSKDGIKQESDEEYLKACETRFIELLVHDAFDVRRFALSSPWSSIGFTKWEEVEGSSMNTTQLRYYPLPKGVKPNGKTLYIASPMINQSDIFDLAPEKSVIEGMLKMGFDLYMVDYGNPGIEQAGFGLDYYGKKVHDTYLDILKEKHPDQVIYIMAYCMGGTLMMPYLARRAEELAAEGKAIDIEKVVLMSTPIIFDDEKSGHKPMRDFLHKHYNNDVMKTFYSACNVPPQSIEIGMYYIQPGIPFTVYDGFFSRANFPGTIVDAAPFLYWLNSGTRFPSKSHQQWVLDVFIGNQIIEGKYCLPSRIPELDGKPVNMDILNQDFPDGKKIALFDYRGTRDPIAPAPSCISSEIWGRLEENKQITKDGLNRTIEKNIGHIFVVSKNLLNGFLQEVNAFYGEKESDTLK